MSPLRVLVLGSYPALNPRHGGQIRLGQIIDAYRASGFSVKQASFFPAHPFYMESARGPVDAGLQVDALHQWHGQTCHYVEDLRAGEVAASDPSLLAAVEQHAGPTDVVHLEQPWMLPVVHKLRERGAIGPFRMVYGSQNIEHELKRALLREKNASEEEAVVAAVLALERACASEATVVAAVTQEDASVLAGWTAAPVVLAGNGVAPWRSGDAERARYRERLGDAPFALYVASAHPPNIHGLCDCFGPSLAGLAPTQRLVLAGHVTGFLLRTDWFRRWPTLNERRSIPLGVLEQEDLSAVRDLAHTFVLPVTAGGGSNLKTAEALYSGRQVVATPMALRGFEDLADLPGLFMAPPGAQFASAVSHSLEEPLPPPDAEASRRRQALCWSHTLAALCKAVASS